jgi:hypothetical protein
MHAVVNRVPLREPLDEAALAAAQRDLDAQAVRVDGLAGLHVLSIGEHELVVLVFGDDEAALERTRAEMGNTFMREHVMPHADGPPERAIAEVVLTYQRAAGSRA